MRGEKTVAPKRASARRRVAAGPDLEIALPNAAPEPPDESPLDYMLRVMRDPAQEPARRDAMAKACAPYVHGRLGSGDQSGDGSPDVVDVSMHEACRRILFTITQAKRSGVADEPASR